MHWKGSRDEVGGWGAEREDAWGQEMGWWRGRTAGSGRKHASGRGRPHHKWMWWTAASARGKGRVRMRVRHPDARARRVEDGHGPPAGRGHRQVHGSNHFSRAYRASHKHAWHWLAHGHGNRSAQAELRMKVRLIHHHGRAGIRIPGHRVCSSGRLATLHGAHGRRCRRSCRSVPVRGSGSSPRRRRNSACHCRGRRLSYIRSCHADHGLCSRSAALQGWRSLRLHLRLVKKRISKCLSLLWRLKRTGSQEAAFQFFNRGSFMRSDGRRTGGCRRAAAAAGRECSFSQSTQNGIPSSILRLLR